MNELGRINKDTERKTVGLVFGIIYSTIFAIGLFFLSPFPLYEKFLSLNPLTVLTLPFFVIVTTIIHELIHIFFFKLLSKGKAQIRLRREKSLGAIVIQQQNPNVFYSKPQTILILLSPLILLSICSLFLFNSFDNIRIILFANCVLNGIGSSIDVYVSLKLFFMYPQNLKVAYNSGGEVGMILYS